MKYKIYLDTRNNQKRKDGYPVVVDVNHKGKRMFFSLGINLPKSEWNFTSNQPLQSSRYFITVKKKKLIAENIMLDYLSGDVITLEAFKNSLLNVIAVKTTNFYEFAENLINELKSKNKNSNARVYENAVNQLKVFRSTLYFNDLDYLLLTKFKDWQIKRGNSKNTISAYLRTYRAIYNEAVRRSLITDQQPFKDVFTNISVKSNRTKKRYLDKATIKLLENLQGLPIAQQRSVDLWLLLFYFGGQDLKDVYYLENKQIANSRVFFERGKLGGSGYEFDLKIVDKANKILKKYKVPGKYVFKWRKDDDGYRTFRDNFRRNLLKAVDNYNLTAENKIQVLPKGGNVTIKVARHSFATIGKQLFIDSDLLRELMGHERNDVDTIYKDKHPEKVRDDAHLKIIS